MKKRKIFKKITLGGLAVVMAGAGIFAFAPIGASASAPPPTTTTTGLGLDPKNDPVVYTTESGLEIKMSNANQFTGITYPVSNSGHTYTQDLSSFYYFTMGTYSGTFYTAETKTSTYTANNEPVNWIILGVGSHSNAFVESVSNYLFSTIKNNDYLFSNGEYFFDNQHETYSPAGQLINSVVSSKTYIMGKVKDSIPVHTDIPKGCMLVLSEKLLGSTYFNCAGDMNAVWNTGYDNGRVYYVLAEVDKNYYGNRYRYYGATATLTGDKQTWNTANNPGGTLYNYINNLFSKNTSGTIEKNGLGFTQAQADLIIPQQLYTYYNDGFTHMQETPQTDGGTYYTMFPLAYRRTNVVYQNFCIEDYLGKSNAQRVAVFIGKNQPYFWGLRSGDYNALGTKDAARIDFLHPEGSYTGWLNSNATLGVRPAMVMKLS